MTATKLPTFEDLQTAHVRIQQRVQRTPVAQYPALDQKFGCQLLLKCEQQQPMGAFKLRGASNAVARLEEEGRAGDLATHSSGNHGAALAMAAAQAGRQAKVVMPANAVPLKMEAVRRYGGEVIVCEPNQNAREAGLAKLVAEGLIAVPPYDDGDIIAGQGTAAIELYQQASEPLDDLVVPVGGGGLLAGCALASRALSPHTRIIGAEPAGAADTASSLASGVRAESWQPDTIADGLRAVIGVRNFALIQAHVDEVLLADDRAIIDAMRLAYELAQLRLEPSAAVALAVIGGAPERFQGRRVGVLLTGGNVDTELFPWLDPMGD